MLPTQNLNLGVNRFPKLGEDSLLTINSFLPPSTVALTSGVSKSFHHLANSTFSTLNFSRTIYHYLDREQICSSVLFAALSMQSPPARELFKMMAGYKKAMEQFRLHHVSTGGTTESVELFVNTVSVALSLKEWTLKSHSGEHEKALVTRDKVFEVYSKDIVRNIEANLKCIHLYTLRLQGKISRADLMMFTARGRKNLENPGVLNAFDQKKITVKDINELDDAAVFQLNSAVFMPFLEEVMKRFDQPK